MKYNNSISFYWFMVLLSIVTLIVSAYARAQLVNQLTTETYIIIEILCFGSFISTVIFLYLIECKNGK